MEFVRSQMAGGSLPLVVFWAIHLWSRRLPGQARLFPCVVLAFLPILTIGACRSDEPATVTFVDSEGVQHTISRYTSRTFAHVDAAPVLNLGGPEVSGPTQFFQLRGVHVDPGGNIWIADGGSNELRIFRPDGSHWKTQGGRGEGPGEFLRLQGLGAFRGDSVAVWDNGTPRLTIFDAKGEFVRTMGTRWGDQPPPRAIDVFPDGSILAKKPVVLSAGSLAPGQLLGDTVDLIRVDLVGRTEEPLGSAPGPLWVFTGTNQIPVPFTINAPYELRGEEVHVSTGAGFQIQVFQAGLKKEEYGVDRDPREVTRADVDVYVGLYERYISDPNQRGEYLSTVDHPARPSHLPGYDRLVVADDGNMWARIYTPDLSGLTWDVYSPDRKWLGQVDLPEGFSLSAVGHGRLFGIWRDDLGVEYVQVFDLRSMGS